MPPGTEQISQLLDLINAGGVTVVLVMVVVLFLRGDVIPRRVYEKLLRDLLSKISADIIAAVSSILQKQQTSTKEELDKIYDRFNNIEAYIQEIKEDRGPII